MGKAKTANQLDARFQWHEGLDMDHIFEEEKEMIQQLREKIPQLEQETDKFIAVFLFSRRHNIKEVKSVLKKFYKKKEEYADAFEGQHIPSFTYTKVLREHPVTSGVPVLQPKGYRDNEGRILRMMVIGQADPARDVNISFAFVFWQLYYLVAVEPLNAWRNGFTMLMDMHDLSWRHMNFNSKQRELTNAMQGLFPFRMRSMLAVNGGALISTFLTAAKVILPRKLMKRFKVLDIEQLKDLIPPEYLVPHFGGSSPPFYFPEFQKQILETESELFSKGIWEVTNVVVAGEELKTEVA